MPFIGMAVILVVFIVESILRKRGVLPTSPPVEKFDYLIGHPTGHVFQLHVIPPLRAPTWKELPGKWEVRVSDHPPFKVWPVWRRRGLSRSEAYALGRDLEAAIRAGTWFPGQGDPPQPRRRGHR